MVNVQLRDFIVRTSSNGMISAEDVKHLQRDVLADGIASRSEAEALLDLDRSVSADPAWSGALVSLLVDFVVWGCRPTGYVTADDARWLAAILDVAGGRDTALRIGREIVAEAQQIDAALLEFIQRGRDRTAPVLAA
jgi:hypothetical protein